MGKQLLSFVPLRGHGHVRDIGREYGGDSSVERLLLFLAPEAARVDEEVLAGIRREREQLEREKEVAAAAENFELAASKKREVDESRREEERLVGAAADWVYEGLGDSFREGKLRTIVLDEDVWNGDIPLTWATLEVELPRVEAHLRANTGLPVTPPFSERIKIPPGSLAVEESTTEGFVSGPSTSASGAEADGLSVDGVVVATPREKKLGELLLSGVTQSGAAAMVAVSPTTVQNTVAKLKQAFVAAGRDFKAECDAAKQGREREAPDPVPADTGTGDLDKVKAEALALLGKEGAS